MRVKTIFVPSGDQSGSRQLIELASENAPPHEGVIGSWCSPLPSAWTIQTASRWSGSVRAAKTILLPVGDQLPPVEVLSDQARRRDLPQTAAVELAHEEPDRPILVAADKDEAFAVRRVVTGDVVAAGVGGDPG